ncbi:hypothetical protein PCC9214_03152 [Planktothrix tepida]|uniref:Inactive STAND domain-containing protein n=1 Tax=Planktothrix tepida PCC 9214 TaxID=671072 RepID=A0A1J1LRS0_9CYAN|nr:hypothetical protein [Planktothrix tepida]CAD5960423.1 hypothetical protein PCC9214_03152 [Planktothrix tepida]CUR34706.1 hypothetical protein PL9214650145 [Planktothrix tepida PCC 9214]
MTTNKVSKPGYILTEKGLDKLTTAISKQYGTSRFKSQLAQEAGLSRNTVSKVLDRENGVDESTLDKLFLCVGLQLTQNDYRQILTCVSPQQQTIQNIVQTSAIEQFKKALFDLNYIDQEYHFRRSLGQMGSVGAFLIHGEEGYGQRWLVNRLAGLIPYNSTAYQKPFNILHKKPLLDFWEDIGESIKCKPNPEAIAEKLYQHWTTQTVILSITDIHKVDQGLESFLEQVWLKVIDKTNSHNYSEDSFKMILFVVGNKTFNSPSNLLIDLTPIQGFEAEELRRWGGAKLSDLLSDLKKYTREQSQDSIKDIIQRNIVPISTLERICKSCSINYYSDIERSFTL